MAQKVHHLRRPKKKHSHNADSYFLWPSRLARGVRISTWSRVRLLPRAPTSWPGRIGASFSIGSCSYFLVVYFLGLHPSRIRSGPPAAEAAGYQLAEICARFCTAESHVIDVQGHVFRKFPISKIGFALVPYADLESCFY